MQILTCDLTCLICTSLLSTPPWQVILLNKSEPGAQPQVFPCGQWFAKDVGDGQIVRTLRLGVAAPTSRVYNVRPQSRSHLRLPVHLPLGHCLTCGQS